MSWLREAHDRLRSVVVATALGAPALMAVTVGTASAQLPSSSAAALGMANSYTAIASGHSALAWNPAGLALSRRPGAAAAVAPYGAFGMNPVTLADLAAVEGLLSRRRKLDWLRRIRAEGGQSGISTASITYGAFSLGRFAVQVASRAGARVGLSPDAAELLLFGNAGRTGSPRDLELRGAAAEMTATSTVAAGYAHPLPLRIGSVQDQRFAVGAVLKYTIGHALLTARDAGGTVTAEPLAAELAFPTVHTEGGLVNGRGLGLDVGAVWEVGGWTASLGFRNVVDGFGWAEDRLRFRPGTATANDSTVTTDFSSRPLAEAPATVLRRVRRMDPGRAIALGVAARPAPSLRIALDLRRRDRDGPFAPRSHAGLGLEFLPLPSLPLRVGAAWISGGHQLGAGLGLAFRRLRLDAAMAHRSTGRGSAMLGMATLSFTPP